MPFARRRATAACLALSFATFAAGIALAHPHGEQWALANEYPATSLPGEGDETFARLVAEQTQGGVSIIAIADGKLGYRSREQLKAVGDGKIAMADTFCGAIADVEPVFGLASLPFIAPTIGDARELYDAARPSYEAAFERHNQKLLYATPWPPSGLWTKVPVESAEGLKRLRVRTYDRSSTRVFAHLAAKASEVPFSDLPSRLRSGEIDAVLSSGDGGAGQKLSEFLPRFTEINYAIPLSFTTVNLDRWNSLDDGEREAIARAARMTEARQWKAIEAHVAANYERMRAQGVTIVTQVAAALRQRLREEGRDATIDWAGRVGPEAREILERR